LFNFFFNLKNKIEKLNEEMKKKKEMRSTNKHNRVINWSHPILAYMITKLIPRAKLALGHKAAGRYSHHRNFGIFLLH